MGVAPGKWNAALTNFKQNRIKIDLPFSDPCPKFIKE